MHPQLAPCLRCRANTLVFGNDVLTRQLLETQRAGHFGLQMTRYHVPRNTALLHRCFTPGPVAPRLSSISAAEFMICVQVAVHMGSGGLNHDVTDVSSLCPLARV